MKCRAGTRFEKMRSGAGRLSIGNRKPESNIEGSIEQGDDFWQDGGDNYICAIEDAHAGNLAAEPTSKIFGKTIESLALANIYNNNVQFVRRDVTERGVDTIDDLTIPDTSVMPSRAA